MTIQPTAAKEGHIGLAQHFANIIVALVPIALHSPNSCASTQAQLISTDTSLATLHNQHQRTLLPAPAAELFQREDRISSTSAGSSSMAATARCRAPTDANGAAAVALSEASSPSSLLSPNRWRRRAPMPLVSLKGVEVAVPADGAAAPRTGVAPLIPVAVGLIAANKAGGTSCSAAPSLSSSANKPPPVLLAVDHLDPPDTSGTAG